MAVRVVSSIGKKQIKVVITMQGQEPKPNQTINNGARASLGMIWVITTYGINNFRNVFISPKKTPPPNPKIEPNTSPKNTSLNVCKTWGQKNPFDKPLISVKKIALGLGKTKAEIDKECVTVSQSKRKISPKIKDVNM